MGLVGNSVDFPDHFRK